MRSPIAVVPLALLLPGAAWAGVVINEILPNPTGTDSAVQLEWIELYNDGTVEEDLSGWTIEAGTSTYGVSYTFPSGTKLAAGDWLLLGDPLVVGADLTLASGTLDLPNASSNADAVRVKDGGGTVVDTLIYGGANSDLWLDDTGVAATSIALAAAENKSIGRVSDGVDSDASGVDFARYSTPTPNASNGTPDTDTGTVDTDVPIDCVAGLALKINEILPNPAGSDVGQEWIELYNPGAGEIDVSGYRISGGTSSWKVQTSFPTGTLIEAGGFLLIGQSLVTEADLVSDAFELGNASNADGVRVEDCYGTVSDTVIYGTDNTVDLWVDDTGATSVSLAPKLVEGKSLARVTDGVDTNASAADFEVAPYNTPGFGNDTPPVDCGGPTSGLKINELLPDAVGADDGLEWVELFNAGSATIDLTGWGIQGATSSWSTEALFESGSIGPGAIVLVGGIGILDADFVVDGFSLPNGTGGDGVRVVDCKGFPADTVVFGSNNDDLIVDDTGAVATSLASDPPEGSSLQRRENGVDTNASGADFALQAEPTPGESNPTIISDPCIASTGTVFLNELMPDPDGTDTGLEWFELYNDGGQAVSLSGWYVSTATQPDDLGAQDVLFGPGTAIPPEGFFVVGGVGTDFADLVKTFSIGNGTGGDALRLYDCEGTPVDTVLYGADGEDLMPDDEGGTPDPYGDPGSNQTLARVDDGDDTNDNEDWFVDASPTPGATNYQEPVVDTGGDDTPGGGCGKKGPPEGDDPANRGCSTLPIPPGSAPLLAVLGLAWRRRRGAAPCGRRA